MEFGLLLDVYIYVSEIILILKTYITCSGEFFFLICLMEASVLESKLLIILKMYFEVE